MELRKITVLGRFNKRHIKTFKVSKKTKKGLTDKPIGLKQRISRFITRLLKNFINY